jgi:protein involved in polysaccharide export with SLBB domain
VRLEGEVVAPGVYQVQPGETLRQLVARVGGLTSNAYLFGSEFSRESTRIQQQRNLDESINRLERDVQRSATVRSQNVVSGEDAATLRSTSDAQQALVARLRQVKATGRIVLELAENARVADLPDLALEDGDRFSVPPVPSMVSVIGTVYSENTFLYRPEKRVRDYLTQAGGPTRDADQSSIYVLRADGSVVSRRQSSGILSFGGGGFDGRALAPGDTLVVPEELDKTTFLRVFKDVSQVFYQMGLGVAAIKVLRQ